MKFHLLLCILLETNADWIRIEHITPTEVSFIRTDEFSRIPEYKNITSILITNKTVDDSVTEKLEERIVEDNAEPLVFNSYVKDTLLKTNWLLSQQRDTSLRGKLKFLQNIKQHLLHGIWQQSRILWRTESIQPRSTFGFPSMEGALITIAFLTFAVFLIKIVQQFIQGLQGFAPNSVGLQMPNIQGARHKRESRLFINEEAARIFKYMDDFKIHHEL